MRCLLVLVAAAALVSGAHGAGWKRPLHLHNATYHVPRETAAENRTALDDYVAKPDTVFSWTELTEHQYKGLGYTGHVLNMTSQAWLTPKESSQPIWWHYMVVVVPDKIDLRFVNTASLYITGGDNHVNSIPTGKGEDEEFCHVLALADQVVCAVLFQVPNQPIVFSTDVLNKSRTEDAVIAFTWYTYLYNTSQSEYLARLPMTKSAVRAMDAVTSFVGDKLGHNVQRFIIAGASKRGWTTWTTAAVDKRVVAMIPIVMDLLKMVPNVHHFYRAFGGWTFAFKDYYALNFTADIDLPSLQDMANIIDPYVYKDRYANIPKLVVDTCGDEFFMPDDNWFWWDEMPGEKHLLMIQDAEHSLVSGLPEVIHAVSAFIYGVLKEQPRPSMTWKFGETFAGGNITLKTSEPPKSVIVHYADTLDGDRRDWRLITGQNPCPTFTVDGACFHPVLWGKEEPFRTAENTYEIAFDAPKDKWRAFFFEVEFEGAGLNSYVFTSQINIIPNTFPFPECHGAECRGTLL